MADIQPSGSTVTIPSSNYTVPGLDTFNDFVSKVNAQFAALASGVNTNVSDLNTKLGTAASAEDVKTLQDTVMKATETAQSDLKTAIDDLTAKFYTAQTSSKPISTSGSSGGGFNWLWIVGAFLIAWLILEKKSPL